MEISMYAYIKGTIVDITEDNVVLECNNIGYNISVSASVIAKLPGIGADVLIYTYTCVREDAFILYGFLSKDDLWIFKKLITVNGIGPKGAMAILSKMSVNDLVCSIINSDVFKYDKLRINCCFMRQILNNSTFTN